MTQPIRSAADLAASGQLDLPPEDLLQADMAELAQSGEPLVIESVNSEQTDEYGEIWKYLVRRQNGRAYILSLWANDKRDAFSVRLMQLLQDGPIGGIRLRDSGKQKPFYYLTVV